MSFIEYIEHRCPSCGLTCPNPRAVHPPDGFINIVNAQVDELCGSCASTKSEEQVYLPMDCPVCGRRRVEWNGRVLRCDKCTTSSEFDGFTSDNYARPVHR